MGRLFYGGLKILVRPALAAAFRLRAYGREHVPRAGGAILASNHQSFLDPILIGAAVDREIDYFARSSLFRGPLAPLIRALNAFPVERARERAGRGAAEREPAGAAAGARAPEEGRASTAAAIRGAIERLRAGRVLLVFPEGTRTATGALGPFQPGVAALARRARVPVVPVAVDGAFEAWPRHRALPRLGRPCAVAIGPAIPPDDPSLLERLRAEIERLAAFLRARCDRPRREPPGGRLEG